MHWFKKHLNWTFFISVLTASIFMNILGFVVAIEADPPIIWWFGLVFVGIFSLGVEIWYLRQKGRRLWYLFLNLLSVIGLIVLLCLENKRESIIAK